MKHETGTDKYQELNSHKKTVIFHSEYHSMVHNWLKNTKNVIYDSNYICDVFLNYCLFLAINFQNYRWLDLFKLQYMT
jgi:hypothetical protein